MTSEHVAMIPQQNRGIRMNVIPGALILNIVTRRLTAPKIEENPINSKLNAQSLTCAGL